MKTAITISAFILLVFNSIAFGTSETPLYPNAVIWEPFCWQFGDGTGDLLISYLDYENDEWTAYRYQDTVENDDSVGDCTRYWADRMGWESGVTLIITHCFAASELVLVATNDHDIMEDWEDDDDNLYVSSEPYTYLNVPLYDVSAHEEYCTATHNGHNWKDEHDEAKSIVWLGICYGYTNFSSAVGGRTVFSYDSLNTMYDHANIFEIITRMVGFQGAYQDDGEFREAFDAYNASTNLLGDLCCAPHNGSTLAPAPIFSDPVSPIGADAGASGTGYIEFDTMMSTSVNANQALIWQVEEGTACVYDIEWDGDNRITFSYSGEPGYEIKMTAVASFCFAANCNYGDGYCQLNGDRIDGNTDDFVWYFSD